MMDDIFGPGMTPSGGVSAGEAPPRFIEFWQHVGADERGWTYEVAEDGTILVEAGDLRFTFAPGSGCPPEVFAMSTEIGRVGTLADPARFFEDALEADFFCRGTEGATLCLAEDLDAVLLRRRVDLQYDADLDEIEDLIRAMAETTRTWRKRLSLYARRPEGTEAAD